MPMELPSKDIMVKLYKDLYTSRHLDEGVSERTMKANPHALAYQRVGEEAIPIALCNNLKSRPFTARLYVRS